MEGSGDPLAAAASETFVTYDTNDEFSSPLSVLRAFWFEECKCLIIASESLGKQSFIVRQMRDHADHHVGGHVLCAWVVVFLGILTIGLPCLFCGIQVFLVCVARFAPLFATSLLLFRPLMCLSCAGPAESTESTLRRLAC